jgi:hypothetical protein
MLAISPHRRGNGETMRVPLLQQLSKRQGPFVTVSIDVSRSAESAVRDLELRWQEHRRQLSRAGVADARLDAIGEIVLNPTGLAGPVGRLIVADPDGVALDLVLPARPFQDEVSHGPAPHLLPVFRALRVKFPYLLAEVDRTGAEVTVVNGLGLTQEHHQVQGSHDELHKVGGGQLSSRRIQARAEDSWARNAAEVARELDRLIAQHHPAVVLLDGDAVTLTDLLDAGSQRLTELAVRLNSGGRAAGVSTTARDTEIERALINHQHSVQADLLDRFGAAEGRQQAAVQSLEDAVDAARRAQVEELFLHDDPASTRTVWVGEQAFELGMTADDVRSLGVSDPTKIRADTALIWAVVSADSGVTLLDPDDRDLADGVGALLRWSDRSTPHDAVPSMPGHGIEPGLPHR